MSAILKSVGVDLTRYVGHDGLLSFQSLLTSRIPYLLLRWQKDTSQLSREDDDNKEEPAHQKDMQYTVRLHPKSAYATYHRPRKPLQVVFAHHTFVFPSVYGTPKEQRSAQGCRLTSRPFDLRVKVSSQD